MQFGQELSQDQQEDLREHPATRRLAGIVEEMWGEWGGRAANNIGWAQAVLGHGSPTLMDKVMGTGPDGTLFVQPMCALAS